MRNFLSATIICFPCTDSRTCPNLRQPVQTPADTRIKITVAVNAAPNVGIVYLRNWEIQIKPIFSRLDFDEKFNHLVSRDLHFFINAYNFLHLNNSVTSD